MTTKADDFALFVAVLMEVTHKHPSVKGPFAPHEVVGKAKAFRRAARTLERLAVAGCERALTPFEEKRQRAVTEMCRFLAADFGANVHTGGDPRGFALKLDLPTGRYNTWGGAEEGWGVPT